MNGKKTTCAGVLKPISLLALVIVSMTFASAKVGGQDALAGLRSKVNHIIVIYQENWSFDSLYGHFPGANGISNASPASLAQVDKNGEPLREAPLPMKSGRVDPSFSDLPRTVPLAPFDLGRYIKPDALTGDIVHRFYTQQLQIDGGRMDKFVAWSDNGGLVMSGFDASDMPEGRLAKAFTLCDKFFQAAFGRSFLNHIWLIAAATHVFADAPAGMRAVPPDSQGLRGCARITVASSLSMHYTSHCGNRSLDPREVRVSATAAG